MGAIFGIAYK